MAEQELDAVLDALAKRLREHVAGLRGVDSFLPANLTQLPRAVLRYLDSPWVISSSRNQIVHTIQIEVIVAQLADIRRARREAARFVRDVKAALFTKGTGLTLIRSPQTTIGPEGVQAIRDALWNDQRYLAATIIIRAVETTGETFVG